MKCPRCATEVAEDRPECPRCGIVFAKYRPPTARPPRPDPAPPRAPAVVASPPRPPRLSARERGVLMEALARGVRAGLPIVELLRALEAPSGRAGGVVRTLASRIEGGATLADAWCGAVRNPGVAAPLLLGIAEETGDLGGACVALGRLDAETLRVRGALVGPLVRPLLTVVAACFLLPIPSAVLGSVGAYLLEVALSLGVVAGAVALVYFGLRALFDSPRWSERMLDLPFGRDVDRWLLATVFEATLRVGTPPVTVLTRLARSACTPARRERFEAASAHVARGGTFTDAIAQLGLFDAMARLEMRTGEEAGELDTVFRSVAAHSSEHLARRLKLASTLVTFVVGLLVMGALALSILATFKAVLGGTEGVLEQIDAETPIRLLDGLQGH